jgi:hypothetical protein
MSVQDKTSKTNMIFSIDDTRKQGKQAIISHLLRRTAGVVNEVRFEGTVNGLPYTEEITGTGCLVKWKSKLLILTAGHVIKTARTAKDVRVISFAKGPTKFVPREEVNASDSDAGENLANEMHFCEWEDLAALPVSDDRLGEFEEIEDRWSDPNVGDGVVSLGMPSDNRIVLGQQSYGNKTDLVVGLMPTSIDVDVLPPPTADDLKYKVPQHDPQRRYLVPYDSPHSEVAHGMSGAGVWVPQMSNLPSLWTPTFAFAGICISVYEKGYSAHKGPVIEVVKASVVRKFLIETFG